MRECPENGGAAFDKLARLYDLLLAPIELMGGKKRRRRLLAQVRGRTLEVGVGTGLNLPFYPAGADVVGVDVSEGMLARARRRGERLGMPVSLEQADVQQLPYPDGAFDTVVATCVFCSVPDPAAGLRELRRVVKRDGQVLLLEHVRPRRRFFAWLADVLVGLTRRFFGDEWNRPTETTVRHAGLEIVAQRGKGIWRELVARPTRE
ncbi:MAG TPA: class I SAM-dependent methyltransferase [Polyangia bacterium]|jgi:ubiquinone/menaquinone biosynthesis C-methylase UbiE